jgi:hypothetical protein
LYRVREILAEGHESMTPDGLAYIRSMADRHGFTILDCVPPQLTVPVRIAINYSHLREPMFTALLELMDPAEH